MFFSFTRIADMPGIFFVLPVCLPVIFVTARLHDYRDIVVNRNQKLFEFLPVTCFERDLILGIGTFLNLMIWALIAWLTSQAVG